MMVLEGLNGERGASSASTRAKVGQYRDSSNAGGCENSLILKMRSDVVNTQAYEDLGLRGGLPR